MNGSRRLIARVAQKRRILDVKSTPLSTTDEITDNDSEITAATIFTANNTFKTHQRIVHSLQSSHTYNVDK